MLSDASAARTSAARFMCVAAAWRRPPSSAADVRVGVVAAIGAFTRSTECQRLLAVLAVVVLTQSLLPGAVVAKADGLAYSMVLEGDIDPSAERDLRFALDDARRRDAEVVIVRLDTAGGHADNTRVMVKAIVAAPMPVIVYVHPGGSRADSAGLLLTLAADVAAMAPQTNIGSATPVWGGPGPRTQSEEQRLRDQRRKVINSVVAFARALAEAHGRNADLAERMVRKAENVTAVQAHRQKLIDVLVPTQQALLRSLDGFAVKGQKAQRLDTSDLNIKHFDPSAIATSFDESYDHSSRSWLTYLIIGVGIAAPVLVGVGQGVSLWRRRRRKRRWLKHQRG